MKMYSTIIGAALLLVCSLAAGFWYFFGTPKSSLTDTALPTSNVSSTTPEKKTFSEEYITGFEGYNTDVAYTLTYDQNQFTITNPLEGKSHISIKEKKTGATHTIIIFNNDAAGFTGPQDYWNNEHPCQACAATGTNISLKADKTTLAYGNDDEEWIISKKDPQLLVIANFKKPSEAAKTVFSTLVLTAHKTPNTPTPEQNTISLKVFWNNARLDPKQECTSVLWTLRLTPKTVRTATVALEELIKGPSNAEVAEGYQTAIPTKAKLKSVTLVGKTATADFTSDLEPGGGSCRVAAIRAQITQTLLQFPTIKKVVISIEGKTDGILQP